MKIKVNPHTLEIQKDLVNEREIDITKCEFEFSEEITQEYVKEAYFTFEGTSYKEIIINNQCNIPSEVLAKKGQIEIGVVAYLVESEEKIKRYNPSPAYFNTLQGSLKDNAENSEPITPSEMEQFEQALQDGINQIANIDINAQETETGGIVEVTSKDGETTTITLTNGEDGEQGPRGETGPAGQDGFSPIANVSKSGKIATITITDKNGTTTETISDGQDGQNGADGKDAKINGVNTLNIEAGENINIEQEGSTMTISSTGGSGGTSDYSELSNKPKINNVELNGNKTTSDLGIDIPDVSNFITKDANNLTYYTLATGTGSTIELSINSSTYVMTLNLKNSAGTTISTDTIDLPLETMVVGGSYDAQNKKVILTLKNGETVEFSVADLVSGLQSEITSSNKLSSDLVDDTNNTNKFVTSSEKTTWNNKSNFSGSYNDLTDKPTIPTVPTNISAFTNDSGYTTTSYVDNKDVIKYSYYINLPITTSQATNYPLTTEDKLKIEEICTLYNADSSVLKSIIIYSTLNKGGSTASTYNPKEFFVNSIDQYEVVFTTLPFLEEKDYANSYSRLHIKQIRLTYNRSAETISVGSSESTSPIASYIGIKNYSSPFVPTMDGHPTNKKYVDDNLANKVIYLGKINNYDTSAKALDITNYKANTRILLKHNDNTRSMFLKFGSTTQEFSLTSASDVAVFNNLYILDINSISSSACSIAFTWTQVYQWAQVVTIFKGASFGSGSWTVNANQYNLLVYPLFQLEEDSNGDLNTTTLQELVLAKNYGMSKTRSSQRLTVHYVDKDKNDYVLCLTSFDATTNVFEGTATTKQPNVNGLYEVKKVNVTITHNSGTYVSHTKTITNIGYVLDGEVEEKDMVVTYSDNTTETVKLVVYR